MSVVFKNTLAPSQTSWVSSCIRGSNRFPVESCVFSVLPHLLRVGSNRGRFDNEFNEFDKGEFIDVIGGAC